MLRHINEFKDFHLPFPLLLLVIGYVLRRSELRADQTPQHRCFAHGLTPVYDRALVKVNGINHHVPLLHPAGFAPPAPLVVLFH